MDFFAFKVSDGYGIIDYRFTLPITLDPVSGGSLEKLAQDVVASTSTLSPTKDVHEDGLRDVNEPGKAKMATQQDMAQLKAVIAGVVIGGVIVCFFIYIYISRRRRNRQRQREEIS